MYLLQYTPLLPIHGGSKVYEVEVQVSAIMGRMCHVQGWTPVLLEITRELSSPGAMVALPFSAVLPCNNGLIMTHDIMWLGLHRISRSLWRFTCRTFQREITHTILHGVNIEWFRAVYMHLYNWLETNRVNLKLWAPRHVGTNSKHQSIRLMGVLSQRDK
jgi:hypothetical protein